MTTHAKDKEMVLHPDRWPAWPLLPLTRKGEGDFPQSGLITPDYPTIVILANLWSVSPTALTLAQLDRDGDVDGANTLHYQDVDGMLDDGWRVD